ncbi:glycosyltransferase family 4 protein [Carnobacterium divergens]|uniref:glycosyltransferase family 4 protein n=1 Tax=Carnobacterium divergens TaxID=2748 RepID=UPI0039B0BC03
MNIGIFTDTYFPQVSGVATSIRTLKEELEKLGHQVTIFTTTDPSAPEDEENIIRLSSIPFFSFKDRRIAIRGAYLALRKAKALELDIIHTHTEFSLGLTGKYIAHSLDIPHVHTYHTMYEDYLHYIANGKVVRPTHVKVVSRYFCNRTVGVIAPSKRVLDQLRHYGVLRNIEIIPTGVNLEKFNPTHSINIRQELGLEEDETVILSLSRLSKEKNTEAIIKAMPAVLSEKPEVKLVIVGDGPYRETLEELAAKLNIDKSILFLGEKQSDEVGAYYQMANLFVSASESESQGLTYIEAIASGTEIVVKDNEYTRSLVRSGQFGLVFQKDEELAKAIIDTLNKTFATEQAERDQLLYDISATAFGKRVADFYSESDELYQYEKKDQIKLAK